MLTSRLYYMLCFCAINTCNNMLNMLRFNVYNDLESNIVVRYQTFNS